VVHEKPPRDPFLFYANIATIVNYASAATFVSLFSFFAAAFRQASSSKHSVGVPGRDGQGQPAR
jgi:hypothetical protein